MEKKEDYGDYMKAQGESRLIQIVRDGAHYHVGVKEAAEAELLGRGISNDELELLIARPLDEAVLSDSEPLDALWTKYRASRTASGWLLLLVILLAFQVVRIVLSYAVIHFSTGQDFGFQVSFFKLFLPMVSAVFAAYTLWKLQAIGWVVAHFAAWVFLANQVYAYVSVLRMNRYHEEFGVEPLPFQFSFDLLLDVLLGLFILVFLNLTKQQRQLGVRRIHRSIGWIWAPLAIGLLFYSLQYFDLSN